MAVMPSLNMRDFGISEEGWMMFLTVVGWFLVNRASRLVEAWRSRAVLQTKITQLDQASDVQSEVEEEQGLLLWAWHVLIGEVVEGCFALVPRKFQSKCDRASSSEDADRTISAREDPVAKEPWMALLENYGVFEAPPGAWTEKPRRRMPTSRTAGGSQTEEETPEQASSPPSFFPAYGEEGQIDGFEHDESTDDASIDSFEDENTDTSPQPDDCMTGRREDPAKEPWMALLESYGVFDAPSGAWAGKMPKGVGQIDSFEHETFDASLQAEDLQSGDEDIEYEEGC